MVDKIWLHMQTCFLESINTSRALLRNSGKFYFLSFHFKKRKLSMFPRGGYVYVNKTAMRIRLLVYSLYTLLFRRISHRLASGAIDFRYGFLPPLLSFPSRSGHSKVYSYYKMFFESLSFLHDGRVDGRV